MIKIIDKKNCSGCGGCTNVCPTDAIHMEEDDEGCLYPFVDTDKCIECHRCEEKCPMLMSGFGVPERNRCSAPFFFAGQLIDKKLLSTVSSGGAFLALEQAIFKRDGVVYGVTQKNVDNVHHIRVTNMEEALSIRRSKYLQSNVNYCYRQVKKDLDDGKEVLFSGTGCQIAALNTQLGEKHSNLYTCEVVCHGVPSAAVWRKYREEKERKENKRIIDLIFREKSKGWSNNHYKITYEDGSVEYTLSEVQDFHAGYLQGLFYRPSCGACPFVGFPREADISLADFWSYDGMIRNLYGDKGISLIVINNSHGKKLFDQSCQYLQIESVSKEKAIQSCRHLTNSPSENENRNRFITMVFQNGYFEAAKRYIVYDQERFIVRITRKVKRLLRDIRWRNPISRIIHRM